MYRIKIDLYGGKPQFYRYLDSVHAMLVNGLAAAGASSQDLVGMEAKPWTFACKGTARQGGVMSLKSILVSTPSEEIAAAMHRLKMGDLHKTSCNGDKLDLTHSVIMEEFRGPVPGQDEICVAFASGFAIPMAKNGKGGKTTFCTKVTDTDFRAALKASLDRRARRELDLEIGIDQLTMMTEGDRAMICLRRAGAKRVFVPSFKMPVTLRGKPEDLSFAYYAGLGAKCNLGFGCPITLE